jgi:hypothetical protein
MGALLAFKPLISPYFWVVIIGSQRICCASQCGLAKETIWVLHMFLKGTLTKLFKQNYNLILLAKTWK